MVIVDCGSGYSRVSNFSRSSHTNLIHATTTNSHIRALHGIMHCPQKSVEWLKELTKIVNEVDAEATQVLLGATGGVRDLIASGEITATEVETFQELLTSTATELPFEAHLLILEGEEEANYEFLSAQYCANHCAFIDPEGKASRSLGLLSSGGMSSQIFVKGISHCLPTQIKKGNKLGLDHGMEKGKAAFYNHAKKVIDQTLPKNLGGENVLYVAIEMFGAVGEKAGMGGGVVVPVTKAMERLSTFMEEKTKEDVLLGEGCEQRTWRTYVPVMSALVGILILEKLHPDSNILFLREFELGGNHVLKPSWPLGYAIEKLTAHETILLGKYA